MTRRVLLFARDPGGANTIIPLVHPLQTRGYDVRLYGKDIALAQFKGNNLSGTDIMQELPATFNQQDVTGFLAKVRPDCIITGTSADDFVEKFIWSAAERLGIPAFAILDQWVNYGVRFSPYSLHELEKYNREKQHPFLPTAILAMDELARQGLVAAGIPPEKVVISGQPHFEAIMDRQKNFPPERIRHIRSEFGLTGRDVLIAFASQPISSLYQETDESEHYWGYTERTIARQLITALDEVAAGTRKKICLLFKLHPKENPENYTDIIQSYQGPLLLLQDKKSDTFASMLASDLICGMSSMFLVESTILGKPTISIQIGLKRDTPFILDEIGVLPSLLHQNDLRSFLQDFITGRRQHRNAYTPTPNAINNIIEIVEEYL